MSDFENKREEDESVSPAEELKDINEGKENLGIAIEADVTELKADNTQLKSDTQLQSDDQFSVGTESKDKIQPLNEDGSPEDIRQNYSERFSGENQLSNGGQYGAQPPNYGQYGAQPPNIGQYGAQPPNIGQYGAQPPNSGQYGAQPPNSGQYGAQPPNYGQYGAQPPNYGQYGNQAPGSEHGWQQGYYYGYGRPGYGSNGSFNPAGGNSEGVLEILRYKQKVPKGYNSFKEDVSAIESFKKNNPNYIYEENPYEGENEMMYYRRRFIDSENVKKESKRGITKSSTRMGLLLLLYIGLISVFQIMISNLLQMYSGDISYEAIWILTVVLQYAIVFPLVIYIGHIGYKKRIRTYLAKPQVSVGFVIKWTLILMGLGYFTSIIFDLLFTIAGAITGIEFYQPTSEMPDGVLMYVVYFIVLVICAPIFEEMLFRGSLLAHHLKYGGWHGIIVSGILFGFIHQNHVQFFYACTAGIILGYVAVKSRSIIPSIIMHMAFNLYSFLTTLVLAFTNYEEFASGEADKLSGNPVAIVLFYIMNIMVYVFIILAIVLLVIELVKNRGSFKLPRGDSGLTERDKYKSFLSSPAMLVFLFGVGLMIVLLALFGNFVYV